MQEALGTLCAKNSGPRTKEERGDSEAKPSQCLALHVKELQVWQE